MQQNDLHCKNHLYDQADGVSMGGSLSRLLANIIMTELEKNVVEKFIDNKILIFYGRYANETLVIKPEHLDLRFTVNTFDGLVPHFF